MGAIGNAVTGAEYKAIREKLKLTQQQLADLLGVHKITVAKREGGALEISQEAEMALRYISDQASLKEAARSLTARLIRGGLLWVRYNYD